MKLIRPHQPWTDRLRLLCLAAFTLLWGTGLLLQVLAALMDLDGWQESVLNGRHISLVLHGFGTWWLLLLVGRVIGSHIQQQMHRSFHRLQAWLGVIGALLLAGLTLSGWLLMYGAGDWHPTMSDVHFGLGLLSLPIWVWHMRYRQTHRA